MRPAAVTGLAVEARILTRLGIPALATFPNVDIALRDQTGSHILDPDNVINRATRAIKAAVPGIGIITDVARDDEPRCRHLGSQ